MTMIRTYREITIGEELSLCGPCNACISTNYLIFINIIEKAINEAEAIVFY